MSYFWRRCRSLPLLWTRIASTESAQYHPRRQQSSSVCRAEQQSERGWKKKSISIGIAVSAASAFLATPTYFCLSSSSSSDQSPRIGGKGSTDLVVTQGRPKELPQPFLDELKALCGDRVILDYEERYFHGKPQHSFHVAVNIPDVVVFPKSTEEVSKIVKACNNYQVPIVPYGGATSIEGHTLALKGGVCINMTNLKDVCVPLSHLAEVISRSKAEIDASPLTCPIIAHAGDGNFHTIILFDPKNDEHRKEAERLNNYMVNAALSLEGTCTGEHGVGTGKMKYLEKELGTNALVTMAKIKHALDPNNIMNPGKLIPTHLCF